MENKEKDLYLAKLLEKNAIKQDEFEDIEYKPEINAFDSKYLKQSFVDKINFGWSVWQEQATPEGFVLELEGWISVEIGTPAKFGTRVKIKRKSWGEEDNLVFIESEATYDKDSDFCELSNRSYEYETWFDHSLNKYLEEDELTHWMPLTKEAQEQSHDSN